MAIYVCPSETRNSAISSGAVMDYMVDSETDIALLPIAPKIKETSTALVIDTGNVYVLADLGWRKI